MDIKKSLEQFLEHAVDTTTQDYNGKVLFIDGMNLYIRCFAATPAMNEDGDHIGGITGFMLSMAAAIRLHRPSRVVIVFDGKGGSQRRRELFKEYKENRKTMVKLNRTYDFNTIDQEHDSRKWQLLKLVEMIKCLPIIVMAPENIEADDAIAYLTAIVKDRNGKSVILSTDKDFLQLVDEHTSVWNPIKKRMYNPVSVTVDYGFHPNNFLLYRAITGDTSDNINGVLGIKEKTLIKHFPELALEDKKDITFLFESAQQQIDAKGKKSPKILHTLLDNRAIIERNIKLMSLANPSMSGASKMNVLEQFDSPHPKLDIAHLTKLAIDGKFVSAFGDIHRWVMLSFVSLNRFYKGI
jgi:DNA polymerase-1